MIKKPKNPVPSKRRVKVKVGEASKQQSLGSLSALSPEVLPSDQEESHDNSEIIAEDAEEVDPGEEGLVDPEEFYSPEKAEGAAKASAGPSSNLPATLENIDFELVPSITSHDPLRRYMAELRHFRLLSSEEEYELAIKLRDQGDLQAAKSLVSANLRLVVKIAFEYRTVYSNVLDLIQEGNIGLMKAVSKFDPTKGARLGYYASWWIRSYILKYLLDNFRLVKVGTTQAQKKLFYHLMREKEKLEAQGMLAGPKLLAEKLNVKEKEVVEMEQRLSGRGAEMSLDAPIDTVDGSSSSHMDFLESPQEAADTTLEREQLLQILRSQLPRFQTLLNEKELRILQERLLAEAPKTLQEVADLYGLTRERARQIEAKVLEKLRELLSESL